MTLEGSDERGSFQPLDWSPLRGKKVRESMTCKLPYELPLQQLKTRQFPKALSYVP